MSTDPYTSPESPVGAQSQRALPTRRDRVAYAVISAGASFALLTLLALGMMLQYFQAFLVLFFSTEVAAIAIISALVGISAFLSPDLVFSRVRATLFGGVVGFVLAFIITRLIELS